MLDPAPRVGSIAALKSGLDALAENDLVKARSVRDGLSPAALDRHILAWAIALYGGDKVPSGDIADAAKMLPELARHDRLAQEQRARALPRKPPPQTVVQAFDGSQPLDIQRAW